MKLLNTIRPFVRIAVAMERIAHCLEYFAIQDARSNNRMFNLKTKGRLFEKDESELIRTSDLEIAANRERETAEFIQHGLQPEE